MFTMSVKNVVIVMLAVFASLIGAASANAYCGPGFSSKASAIKYYEGPGKKYLPSMHRTLVKRKLVQKDEAIMSFLKSDRVVYKKTPKGYHLKWNTLCKGSAYQSFRGNLKHSNRGVLAIKATTKPKKNGKAKVTTSAPKVIKTEEVQERQPDGSISVYEVTTTETTTTTVQGYVERISYNPFMKDYCRNLSGGRKWGKSKKSKKSSETKAQQTSRKLVRTIPVPPKDGTQTPPPPTTPVKDGTQTPPTPPTAPGPNPAPADNVSSECFDEVTGQPTPTRADGTCRAGSVRK